MKTLPRSYHQSVRAVATEATGQRIVDAFLSRLMEHWFDEITLDQVAEDAAVTVQTVVRRFGGKEGLLKSAVKVLAAQIEAQRAAAPGDLDELVENLIGDYEKTGDAVVRMLALEQRHPAVKPVLELGRGEHRKWTANAFAAPLKQLEDSERQQALDAMVILSDVYTWKLLRRDMGRSIRATAATMTKMLQATINEFLNQKKGHRI
jgi:AcrR family transcriptional regulator